MFAVAVAAVVLAGLVGGIFVEQIAGFRDGGPVPRTMLPIARTVHDIAASITIGLLLVAGTMVPESPRTNRRRTACRIATVSGVVWVVAGTLTLLSQISVVSGVPLTDPTFFSQVTSVVWSMDYFRVQFLSILVALIPTIGSTLVRTVNEITWMAALAIVALLPLALAGHGAGAADHDTAVNSLAVHIAAAAVWTGGLAALLILRPILGTAAAITVKRFSLLAAWCFGGVAISGVINGMVRLGAPSELASTYGGILLAKIAILGLLGLAGFRMRQSIVDRLAVDEHARGAFAKLAAIEVTLMAAAMGLAVALSKTPPPVTEEESGDVVTALTGYPAPEGPLTGWGWFTMLRVDWLWFSVVCLGIALYVGAVIRLRRRGDSWSMLRTAYWISGWLIFFWATSGAPGVYGRLQFSVHMLMHMTLSMAIPLLLCLAAPLSLAARALPARRDKTIGPREIMLRTAHSRYLNFWAHPIIAPINFFGSLILFYFTGLFELALRTHTGHVVMIVHFMLAGYMFCWLLVGEDPGPKRWPPSLRLVLLFATMSFHAFFGVALLSSTSILGLDYFRQVSLPWLQGDAALLADQADGGAITWGIGELPMLALALMVGLAWMRQDEHEAKRTDRQAARDHDAALEAYNAELQRRGEAYRRSQEQAAARYAARHPRRSHQDAPGTVRQDAPGTVRQDAPGTVRQEDRQDPGTS